MKLIAYIITLFTLIAISSCAFKSVIIAPKYKKNIVLQNKTDWLENQENSILNSPVSLEKLLQHQANIEDRGRFFVYLSNEDYFLYANINSGSDTLEGILYNKTEKDTINFTLKYQADDVVSKLDMINEQTYRVTFTSSSDKSRDTILSTFYILNSNNFIISPNCELLTGEIRGRKGLSLKYLIVNDPTNTHEIIDKLGIFDIFVEDSPYYLEKCKSIQVKIGICPKNFHVYEDFSWREFTRQIICDCEKITK